MKKIGILLILTCSVIFSSCKENKDNKVEETKIEEAQEEERKVVEFTLESKSDTEAKGKFKFTEENGVVTMHGKFWDLSPGTHAVHIHEKADCSSPDGKSAGGHWNPTFENHGKWGDTTGFHKGDIGNFQVSDKGTGVINLTTDLWCIGCVDEKKDILGKAIIVHQGTDDFVSQPSGAAGARISCGGIIE
ncbi:MAG: Cu-Zn family superoxide dismutase [Flavobacteriaceae bacterium]|jgi:Cu-Zn family superoxide dismutase|uniref:superoxide dismutase family protein n=1 Tax=Candidatus Marifrigoribacter sp. Uisw_064 TaxID=3230970 RepID=UPI003AEB3604